MNQQSKRKIYFAPGDVGILMLSVAPGILIAAGQETLDDVSQWQPIIDKISEKLIAANLSSSDAPLWCVSSIRRTITAKDRDAASHMEGRAIDVAPIYSLDTLTAPDASTPNLAADVINLLKIAQLKDPSYTLVVEGDHLHITANPDPLPEKIVTYPTLISWYNAGEVFSSDKEVQSFLKRFYGFNPATHEFAPLSEAEKLEVGTALNN